MSKMSRSALNINGTMLSPSLMKWKRRVGMTAARVIGSTPPIPRRERGGLTSKT